GYSNEKNPGRVNSSLHPQSRRANGFFAGGGRLQFCLFDSMPQVPEGLPNLLFFTFCIFTCPRIFHGLAHAPLHQSRQQLVELDSRNHGPGHDDLTLSSAIPAISRSRHPLGRDPAHRLWTHVPLPVSNHVLSEFSAHISRTDSQHIDVVASQFHP